MNIEGTTKIVGVIGYPIKHSASPVMHNAAFKSLGLDYVYLPFEVRPGRIGEAAKALTSLGMVGINVTIPHKETIRPYLNEISREAELIGAVNTVVVRDDKLIGYNTDGQGFIASLREDGKDTVKGKTLLVLGAGGAAKAVVTQAALEGAGKILVIDKFKEKAEQIVHNLGKNIPSGKAQAVPLEELKTKLREADFLINATPVGMNPDDPLIIDPGWLSSSLLVFDLVYNLGETKLMKAAREKGCRVVGGLGMLAHQGAISFQLWTGKEAPLQVMRKALEEKFQDRLFSPRQSAGK